MGDRISMTLLLILVVMSSSLGLSAPTSNHLAGQSSVYLSRAAAQPVDWYPWSAEAFEHAQKRNRPILLDVGAVWCLWRRLSGFVPGKTNYVIIYGEGCLNSKRQARRTVELYNKYRNQVHFVVVDLDERRSPEQQELVKKYYQGSIPHVLILDANGRPL
jgi:thiol-disulfide isomerase/thioredoxin